MYPVTDKTDTCTFVCTCVHPIYQLPCVAHSDFVLFDFVGATYTLTNGLCKGILDSSLQLLQRTLDLFFRLNASWHPGHEWYDEVRGAQNGGAFAMFAS